MQPCEVSKKISISLCRWKSAPEAMTACWKCFVMFFGGKTRLCVCSSCCGIDRMVTKSTMKPSSLQNKCSTTQGDTRLNEESNRLCKQNTDFPIPKCLLRDTRSVRMRHGRHCTASKVRPNLGARSRRFVCDIAICFQSFGVLFRMVCAWNGSSILSPDRKWSSAWQWLQHFHREGLSTNVRQTIGVSWPAYCLGEPLSEIRDRR